jgi:predicted DNA-binding WGR domain protein
LTLSERNGSTLPAIKKALNAEQKQWKFINAALKSGVEEGKFIKNGGKYKAKKEKPKKPKKKVVKVKKKKTVKKVTKKKPKKKFVKPKKTTVTRSRINNNAPSFLHSLGAAARNATSGVIQHEKVPNECAGARIIFDADLSCINNVSNKFYRLQAIKTSSGKYYSIFHWGASDTKGQCKITHHDSSEKAVKACQNKRKDKTKGNKYQEMQSRVAQAGGQQGEIQISLMWNNQDGSSGQRNDLDLHVIPPSKEEIFFSHKDSMCGGKLDVDKQEFDNECVENIVWGENSPHGTYNVYVKNYCFNRSFDGLYKEFDVGVTIGSENVMISSSMAPERGAKMHVASFNFQGLNKKTNVKSHC